MKIQQAIDIIAGRNKPLEDPYWRPVPPGWCVSTWEFAGYYNRCKAAVCWPDKLPEGVGRILWKLSNS